MNWEELRRLAAVLREVPLESVLRTHGAKRDRHDRAKWHTEVGSVSVTGSKFTSWHHSVGGGGAIDLAMHLGEMDYRTALAWLHQHFGASNMTVAATATDSSASQLKQQAHVISEVRSAVVAPRPLRLPVRNDRVLSRVREYLTVRRHLPKQLVEQLIGSGKLYADGRGNAVFLLVAGKANHPVGAELRGTGNRVWRGLAHRRNA